MKNSKAFTLIELLVVISIIAVLTAILLPNLVGIRGRAADARKKADLKDFQAALRLYYNDNQAYPTATGDDSNVLPVTGFTDGTYSSAVPEYLTYENVSGTDGYIMGVELINTADPDIGTSQDKCGGSGAGVYYVCAR
ncbi:MAG: type II secretion system protein [bacterium]|nr:type II secretion system protein [bacterium]